MIPKVGEEAKIKGKILRIRFSAKDTGYTVLELLSSRNHVVTLTGLLGVYRVDDEIRAAGTWVQSKYGLQLSVKSSELVLPETAQGIESFLSTQIEGIGPRLAKRIVAHLGDRTLDILDREPHRLGEIPGIRGKKLESVLRQWEEKKAGRESYVFLQGLGLTHGMAGKLIALYGNRIIAMVKHRPYALAKEVDGVGFVRADAIAQSVGFSKNDPQRIEAGLDYVLYQSEQNEGHCYLPFEELLTKAAQILEVGEREISAVLGEMRERGALAAEKDESGDVAVYRQWMHNVERSAALHLSRLLSGKREIDDAETDKVIALAENRLGLPLAEAQRLAVKLALTRKVLVITGGPGTGKTTLIRVFVDAAQRLNRSIVLAAPTGRASKRLSEATGREAKTIHRLLEYGFGGGERGAFHRNEDNPLPASSYIIDESSMIDIALLRSLLCAIPDEAELIFVGDTDQLPSVGPGNVLKDLIDSGEIPVVRLTEVFRQAEQSLIVHNAHRINNGLMPESGDKNALSEFYVIHTSSAERAEELTAEMVCKRIPEVFRLDPMSEIQVLCPMRKNAGGVDSINAILQERLNPGGEKIRHAFAQFRVGDRVMQLKNDYENDVYNGDVGIVTGSGESGMRVDFDGRIVEFSSSQSENTALAYACTVHKSQGSEYPAVICLFLQRHYFMLRRNLVYTALTRAKRLAIFITDDHTLRTAIENNKTSLRYTRLACRVADCVLRGESAESVRAAGDGDDEN